MAIVLGFMAVLAAVVVWWAWHHRLASKPWLEQGPVGHFPDPETSSASAAKLGLGVFLAVVCSLFALFLSAYVMRMEMGPDWKPLPDPGLLWVNTGILVLSSVALQRAQVAARRSELQEVRSSLMAGGASAIIFVAGQLLAWWQLTGAGYLVTANPANAFFYLITAVHGLHLLGGLVALGRTLQKASRARQADEVRLSVELCAVYWHFLLLLWFVLFGLLLLT